MPVLRVGLRGGTLNPDPWLFCGVDGVRVPVLRVALREGTLNSDPWLFLWGVVWVGAPGWLQCWRWPRLSEAGWLA